MENNRQKQNIIYKKKDATTKEYTAPAFTQTSTDIVAGKPVYDMI